MKLLTIKFLSHLSTHSMHGNDGSLVRIKIYEAVSSGLPGELVGHHLDADHPTLPHHVDSVLNIKLSSFPTVDGYYVVLVTSV